MPNSLTIFTDCEYSSLMTIKTVQELVEKLGGPAAVAEWAGVLPSAVCNWYDRGIPPGWHLRLLIETRKRGLKVAPQVFELSDDDAKFLAWHETRKPVHKPLLLAR